MADSEAPEVVRLFVAITLPDSIKSEIQRAQAELRRAVADGSARWTRPEQFHLTLRFLGNVAAERVAALVEALRGACKDFAPLRLAAEGVGFFPKARAPRVVWVGLQDRQGALAGLQAAIQNATRNFTSEAPEERFSGHVTLGRIKSVRRPEAEALGQAAGKFAQTSFGEWRANSVELIRSQLSSQGPSYSVLAEVPLVGLG
jgi:2'-5' RNA ligase